ncbi:hypothetical protein [Microseira wollei]|uniref:DUF29 family protein n=1 Tax=Microseira wollei NIES-4236 TaxID=2530354 RepID=A0AAV3XQ11_9CYAN|nr:hypothetical protein [Microseira wollei]GET42824.1 hypothetical protein MiSe_76420 [Microseira wollei NIES-4236]
MIQELSDLRNSILEGRYQEALALIEQLDGMSRQAKLGTIESFLVRMLIHLIKNQIEQRLTNSSAASIRGSLVEIKKWNLPDNKTSYYVNRDEWEPMIEDAMEVAISDASVEVFNGAYTPFQVDEMVDRIQVITIAQELLSLTYTHSKKELPAVVNDRLTQLPGGEDWKEGRQR